MAGISMPRSSFSMPRMRARGVSASMIHPLDARRRSTSQTSPAIDARSPEAAESLAAGVMSNSRSRGEERDPDLHHKLQQNHLDRQRKFSSARAADAPLT